MSFPPETSSKSLSTRDPAPSAAWPKCCSRRASIRARVFSLSASLPWATMTTASCAWRSIPLWTGVFWTQPPSTFGRRSDSEPYRHRQIPPVAILSPPVRKRMTSQTTTHSAEETIAFGRSLAAELSPPLIVLLRGDLGAGKTTLVKGIAEGFGAARAEDVTSPTFTLVHEYRGTHTTLYHIDLYRIDTQRDLETLGLDDLLAPNSILLIEWGEKFPRLQRDQNVEITLERVGETERRIQVTRSLPHSIIPHPIQ